MHKNKQNNTRLEKAATNASYNFAAFLIKTILMLVTRTVFIRVLNSTLLGANSLFTNILSMLSLAEMGVSVAISYSLYAPLAKKDDEKTSIIISFYRKIYRTIGIIVLVLGVILSFFLPLLVKDLGSIPNPYIIYYLFLLNVVISYFITYKEVLATADQKAYIISKTQIFIDTITNVTQIIILILTKDYLLYLISQIIVQIVGRMLINKKITNEYRKIDFKTRKKMSPTDIKTIKSNVSAMFLHKIGDYCINSTDSLIISAFISVSMVGVYSNYLTIITVLTNATSMVFNSLTSTLGNILVTEKREKRYDAYRKIDFAGYIVFSYCALLLLATLDNFIKLWAGNEYVIDKTIEILIIANFYLVGMRIIINVVKNSAGQYRIDRFAPLCQSAINLIVSIILVQKIGLLGVIIGTISSSILIPMWQRPFLVYKHILRIKPAVYFKEHALYLFALVAECILFTFANMAIVNIGNPLIEIIVSIIAASIIYATVNIIFFSRNQYFIYYKNLIHKRVVR